MDILRFGRSTKRFFCFENKLTFRWLTTNPLCGGDSYEVKDKTTSTFHKSQLYVTVTIFSLLKNLHFKTKFLQKLKGYCTVKTTLKVRSHCAIATVISFIATIGLYRIQCFHIVRLQHYQLLYSPFEAKTNCSPKSHGVNGPLLRKIRWNRVNMHEQ